MTNQALPTRSRDLVGRHLGICRNLGLILDRFAPWGQDDRAGWDLVMRSTVRRGGQNEIRTLSGGEAKGIWLDVRRRALANESLSLFEVSRTDVDLMRAFQDRWREVVRGGDGIAFTMITAERLVAGLGASHVLETALTLDRNTGLPYLPGSSVKGLARAWGLIEVASQLGITLDDEDYDTGDDSEPPLLSQAATLLISEPDETLLQEMRKRCQVSDSAEAYIQWFRFIFGSQGNAGAICFLDAIYHGGQEPRYASDVMTPHYVNYYTDNGSKPPSEDDNPNPVSFITVDAGNIFAFGLLPRLSAFSPVTPQERANNLQTALNTAKDWLAKALSQLGAGSKTAAGYGYFNLRSLEILLEPERT